jgi:hypothetical protein
LKHLVVLLKNLLYRFVLDEVLVKGLGVERGGIYVIGRHYSI